MPQLYNLKVKVLWSAILNLEHITFEEFLTHFDLPLPQQGNTAQ